MCESSTRSQLTCGWIKMHPETRYSGYTEFSYDLIGFLCGLCLHTHLDISLHNLPIVSRVSPRKVVRPSGKYLLIQTLQTNVAGELSNKLSYPTKSMFPAELLRCNCDYTRHLFKKKRPRMIASLFRYYHSDADKIQNLDSELFFDRMKRKQKYYSQSFNGWCICCAGDLCLFHSVIIMLLTKHKKKKRFSRRKKFTLLRLAGEWTPVWQDVSLTIRWWKLITFRSDQFHPTWLFRNYFHLHGWESENLSCRQGRQPSPVKYTLVILSHGLQRRDNTVFWCCNQVIQMSHVLPTCNEHHIYNLQSILMSPRSGCLVLKPLEYMHTETGRLRQTDRLTVQNTYGGDEI